MSTRDFSIKGTSFEDRKKMTQDNKLINVLSWIIKKVLSKEPKSNQNPCEENVKLTSSQSLSSKIFKDEKDKSEIMENTNSICKKDIYTAEQMLHDYKTYSPDELYAMAEKEILENIELYKENSKLMEARLSKEQKK